MLNHNDETFLPLARALNIAFPDRGVSAATAWRWHKRGVHGIRLETWLVGGRRATSIAAIYRFITATTAARDGHQAAAPLIRTPRQRQREIERADHELSNLGV